MRHWRHPPLQELVRALAAHWPEYLIEATLLGLFMVSASLFAIALFLPESPAMELVPSPLVRRLLMGAAMGATAIALIYSPWGKRSGAHFNPAVTLTFFSLGKIGWPDAAFYIVSQFAGGTAGVLLVSLFANQQMARPEINYVVTVPGPDGVTIAWFVEFAISAVLMYVVLTISNQPRFANWTGVVAGCLVAMNIAITAPLSGMSMNPARTFGSAVPSGTWTAWWVYFTAPPMAMLFAARLYVWIKGRTSVHCAKLHHENLHRCIFCNKPGG
ncbi:MAG: aquaporin [Pirellulaceae bacterium]